MKSKIAVLFAALLLSAGFVFAATNDLTTLLQKGLLEEEANHNLEAALRHYQAAIDGFDQDRQLAATAVFRLGECLRKLGRTNEAGIQYERVVREFPDQTNLVKLCSDYLGGARTPTLAAGGPDAKLQQLQASYDDLKLKWTLTDGELATVTNLSKEKQKDYFTTVKPDSALLTFLAELSEADKKFSEVRGLGYGSNHPTYLSAQWDVNEANDRVAKHVDALVWGLRQEAQVLHDQGEALRVWLGQARQGVAGNAPVAGSAAQNSATSAEEEEVRKIQEMIRNSPDLINTPRAGVTPLQSSVESGNIAAAELLLANGAMVNETSPNNRGTPLGMAALRGNKAMIELLLAKGADVNLPDNTSAAYTPLHSAVVEGFKTAAEVLIAHKASVNARRGNGNTPLHDAANDGFSAMAELLIGNGANVNAASSNGETPLFAAVQNNRTEIVQLLLSNKAEVNFTNTAGETPLFRAIQYDYPDMVKLLLSNKAAVNFTNSAGETPLFLAVKDNRAEVVPLLLSNQAEVNARDKSGYTPLHRAVLDNHPNLVKLLLSNKADVNASTDIGITPLLFAAARYDIDINLVKSLLENGADPQAHIKEGGFSVHPDPDIPNIPRNVPPPGGMNPPMFLRIEPGVDALDLAIQALRADEMELLLAAHADPNVRYVSNQRVATPLLEVILQSAPNDTPTEKAEELKILLNHGADPNLASPYGDTPLTAAAAAYGGLALVQQLLDHHADPNKPDDGGLPPLAHSPGNMEIRAALLKAGANEDYQRLAGIFIAQKGTGSIGWQVFYKGTSSVNHYTVLELIAEAYKQGPGFGAVPFPDFTNLVINRLGTNSAKAEINVNLDEILASGDCSKDVPLEWGDVIQIPQLDHPINEFWQGLPFPGIVPRALEKCLQRQVEIIVKGQTNTFTLAPRLAHFNYFGVEPGRPPEKTLYTFLLDDVVHQANVLLLSSDLSRVKVTRHGVEMQYNLEPLAARRGGGGRGGGGGGGGDGDGGGVRRGGRGSSALNNNSPDLWLRDGDVIEIPERDPNVPLVK